jgi:hypothetical protein
VQSGLLASYYRLSCHLQVYHSESYCPIWLGMVTSNPRYRLSIEESKNLFDTRGVISGNHYLSWHSTCIRTYVDLANDVQREKDITGMLPCEACRE